MKRAEEVKYRVLCDENVKEYKDQLCELILIRIPEHELMVYDSITFIWRDNRGFSDALKEITERNAGNIRKIVNKIRSSEFDTKYYAVVPECQAIKRDAGSQHNEPKQKQSCFVEVLMEILLKVFKELWYMCESSGVFPDIANKNNE